MSLKKILFWKSHLHLGAGNYFLLKKNYDKYFKQALKIRRLIMKDYIEAWSKVDVLLTPVTLSPPPLFSEFSNVDNRTQTATQDFCTQPMNLAGLNKVCRLKQVYLSSMLSNEKVYLFKSAHFRC